jgi:aminocarboxymuconate-semialdehyde decarboxylase
VKLDCYPHILPAPVYERMERIPLPTLNNPTLYDVDARLRVMDRYPDYAQVLVPFPTAAIVPVLGTEAQAAEAIRAGNEHLAELTAKDPERFPAFVAALPLFDGQRAAEELVYCLDELGAVGVQLETNVRGVPLDEARFAPLFAELAARERPAWLHPTRGPMVPEFASEERGTYGLWQALGWPYETSLVMARLVLGGIFDRHPGLPLIIHHGGGMIPHFAGRLGRVLENMAEIGFAADLEEAVGALKRPVDDYFRMFYADTVLFGAGHAVQCVLDYFGLDHVLFGTDMPFDPEQGPTFITDTMANVEALPLAPEQRAAVFEGNTRRLLRL